MITDPMTTPERAGAQVAFGLAVALAYGVVQVWRGVFAMFFGLTFVCFARGSFLYLQSFMRTEKCDDFDPMGEGAAHPPYGQEQPAVIRSVNGSLLRRASNRIIMLNGIAILGLACEFPGAHTPQELWETALFKRRWFRKIPPERLSDTYFDVRGGAPDTTYIRSAGILEGYAFPQRRFDLGSHDLLAADFAQWLALDCADRALTDSALGDALPRDSTRTSSLETR